MRGGFVSIWIFLIVGVFSTTIIRALEIPTSDITGLQENLKEAGEASSTTRKRLGFKRVVREGLSLAKDSPEAANRWEVLGIALQGQKQLFALEDSIRNLEELIEISEELLKAPDEYAELRLEADLLVSERELSLRDADVVERAKALRELIGRYRDTPGEAKSLMVASQIAPKLEAFDLEIEILRTMQDRFADHHGVIEFRRKSLSAGRVEALFRGEFSRADGTMLSFPVDRLGHPCLLVFWSEMTNGYDVALKQMAVHQELYPNRFDIYSFNLDGLPDWGEGTLRKLGLDWTVMQLPEGRKSQVYRTFGIREPVCILSNAYGYTLLRPTENFRKGADGMINPYLVEDVRITPDRYLVQLQSLFVGDFLVASDEPTQGLLKSVPDGKLKELSECFPLEPFRYRLQRAEALANYQKAEKLSAGLLKEYADAKDLWWVSNRRLIALLGMWKLAVEPKYLEQAAKEAEILLKNSLPEGADMVARFCLSKAELRKAQIHPKPLFESFLAASGKGSARQRALAALTILTLDANSRELHQQYRQMLLAEEVEDPAVWQVAAFLRDRFHTLDLLKVKLSREERRIRSTYGDFVSPREHAINHSIDPMTQSFPDIELKALDGETLKLPAQTKGKLTLLLFVEPPAENEEDFPVELDRNGKPSRNDPFRNVMGFAKEMAGRHIHGEVEVITAFLSENAEQARSLMEKNEWQFKTVLVPGGLYNPMVRQLGILSADKIPNVFLLRRDSTIAWHTSGFIYKSDFGYPFAVRLAMKVHIEKCDTELAYKALARKDYQEAHRIFSGPFLPEKDERYLWRAPRFHGRALANVGLGKWEDALADIDVAIEYQRTAFKRPVEKPSISILNMLQLRATILEKSGRKDEALESQKAAQVEPVPYRDNIYDSFHRKLADLSFD